jgi:hypothetical protein
MSISREVIFEIKLGDPLYTLAYVVPVIKYPVYKKMRDILTRKTIPSNKIVTLQNYEIKEVIYQKAWSITKRIKKNPDEVSQVMHFHTYRFNKDLQLCINFITKDELDDLMREEGYLHT